MSSDNNDISITTQKMASLPDVPDVVPVLEEHEPVDPKLVVQPAVPAQKKVRSVPTGKYGRVACLGGCGTMVIPSMGECRKCRKARLRNGLKHILKVEKVPA